MVTASKTPAVKFEKPGVPTLWIDTSVVIKLTKIHRGEALQDVEIRRGRKLHDLVTALVRDGKLLCPESDQEEEYVANRLDDEVCRMFAHLSLGISLTHRQGIFDSHVYKGMNAYAKSLDQIVLPVSTYFHGDPVRKLEEARQEKFIVFVSPLKSPDILKRRASAKANTGAAWERLRRELVSSGQSYEKQLEVEQRGDWTAFASSLRKFTANLVSGRSDLYDYLAALGPLNYRYYWNEIGGKPPDWEGVSNFFHSAYFTELPLPSIQSRLIAELLTGNEPISPSDPMDVDLLAVALPLSHFALTDRRMEQRIKKLGLDTRCGTLVVSMSTIDSLFVELEKLR